MKFIPRLEDLRNVLLSKHSNRCGVSLPRDAGATRLTGLNASINATTTPGCNPTLRKQLAPQALRCVSDRPRIPRNWPRTTSISAVVYAFSRARHVMRPVKTASRDCTRAKIWAPREISAWYCTRGSSEEARKQIDRFLPVNFARL